LVMVSSKSSALMLIVGIGAAPRVADDLAGSGEHNQQGLCRIPAVT
jgi:hypothetical protein